MSAGPEERDQPSLQAEETAAPPPIPANRLNIDLATLTLSRFNDPNAVVAAAECAELLLAAADDNGGQSVPFRNTLCPLAPEAAVKARLLDVGTDIDSEAEVLRAFEDDQWREAESRRTFGDHLSEFYCWRRWREIAHQATLFSTEVPKVADVQVAPLAFGAWPHLQPLLPAFHQGVLNDHFALLAISALCTDSRLFATIFASVTELERGMITFRFFPESKVARYITIDTLLPCAKDVLVGRPRLALGRTDDANEFWLALLLKGYATFTGSYAHLHGGDAPTVLRHMTGGDISQFRWAAGSLQPRRVDELWWALEEAMRLRCVTIATMTSRCTTTKPLSAVDSDQLVAFVPSGSSAMNWSFGAVVHFAVAYDKSKEKTDYANIRERRLEPDVYRLIKLSVVFPEALTELRRVSSWGPASAKWNAISRAALGNPEGAGDTNDRVVWLTVEEFAAHFDILATATNFKDDTDSISRYSSLAPFSKEMAAVALPHFLLEVTKPDDVTEGTADWTRGVDCNFKSIFDLKPNELDLGEETDDDVDPMSQSRTTTVSSHRSSVVDVAFSSPNVLVVEATLSFPAAKFSVPFAIQAFRVPRAERQQPVKQLRDGVLSYTLPVHSRVPVVPVAPQIVTAVAGQTSITYRFEVEVNTGFYNFVVVPERDFGDEKLKFSLTVTKRQNAENYAVAFTELAAPPMPAKSGQTPRATSPQSC